MHNIVSIDFDILMAPSIWLYNDMIGPEKWENEFMGNPQLALCQADLQHYQRLLQWLLKIVPNMDPNNIHFILDHEKLIDFLPQKEDIVITNIDHHHDVAYDLPHFETPITLNNLTCGNWIKYISDNHNLVRYHWINNSNSTLPNEKVAHLVTSITDFRTFNFESLATPHQLIICLSPMWVPPTYRPLFYTIMDVCNFIHNTHFTIEG